MARDGPLPHDYGAVLTVETQPTPRGSDNVFKYTCGAFLMAVAKHSTQAR